MLAVSRVSRSLSTRAPIQRHEILTLLHKTTSLLPRALASKEQAATAAESLDLWQEILSDTYNDLTSTKIRPVRIAVYGLDQWSGAQDLVTALLEEPLTSDQSLNDRIRGRWNQHSDQRSLTLSPRSANEDPQIHLPSSFFQQFDVPLQINELSPTPVPKNHTFDKEASDALLKADVAIILCNPITTSIPALLREPLLSRNPNTVLVVTSTPSKSISEELQKSLLKLLPNKTSGTLKVLFADPSRAVAANETFKSDFQSSTAVQRYQDDFVGSQVSAVTAALKRIIPSGPDIAESSLRSQTALVHIRAALLTCQAALHRARGEMDSVAVDVCTLKAKIEEAKVKAQAEVLGTSSTSGAESDVVVDAVDLAAKQVKIVMDRLTWWRMVWRVDEISHVLTQAVLHPESRALEQQLVLQTGRLVTLQDEITKSTFAMLASHKTPPFNSAILRNSLHQLIASPSCRVTPLTLTRPIDVRRGQVIEHPTTKLHVAAQRTTLTMGGGIAASAGITWAGWLGWLSGSGEGLLGAVGLDAGTAVGVGLLTAVATLRWGVGKWERAKQKWWADWDRVGAGLGRDLRATLDQTMQNKVLVVPEKACDQLSKMIVRRRDEIEEVEEELDTLRTTIDALEPPSE